MNNSQSQSGFALLVSLVVVGVVISVGVALLDVSTKQLRLSTNSVDSEVAFHAANAGAECAMYWRQQFNAEIDGDELLGFEPGQNMSNFECFSSGSITVLPALLQGDPTDPLGDGSIHHYSYEFDWPAGDACTRVEMTTAAAFFGASADLELTATQMRNQIPGYPDQTFSCPPSSRCTVISVRGYNRDCLNVGSVGTVQREVLLEF